MLATSPSPNTSPTTTFQSGSTIYSASPRLKYDRTTTKPINSQSSTVEHTGATRKRPLSHVPESHQPRRFASTTSLDRYRGSPRTQTRPKMVDASTQYSPPVAQKAEQTPTSPIAGLKLSEADEQASKTAPLPAAAKRPCEGPATRPPHSESGAASAQTKRHAAEPLSEETQPGTNGLDSQDGDITRSSPVKKPRPDAPPVRMMPLRYETCNTRDLVVLIASMLMELIRYNDAIPLRDGQLTRFHSRAPPGISVLDYLQRLTTHATLSPPILLSVVYYIDRLCAIYPAFTISSLTVHRFLITSATVASKGLSDSFWTNKTYARVGGVSMKELALLELEFLMRMDWRIVPKPEVLVDYYKSLIGRNSLYRLAET